MNIAVVGLWHLGLTYSAGLLKLGHTVTIFDENSDIISEISHGTLPISEPGIAEIFEKSLANNDLIFGNKLEALSEFGIIWFCADTTTDEGGKADIIALESAIIRIGQYLRQYSLIIISSQVPLGTCNKLQSELDSRYPDKKIRFCYNPENLQLGDALKTFLNASRQVFGLSSDSDKKVISEIMRNFQQEVVFTTLSNAELLKHSLNAYLAVTATFANEIANLAQNFGANAFEVAALMKTDPRVGQKAYLNPGPSFGGGTLLRDLNYLEGLGNLSKSNIDLIRTIKISNQAHFFSIVEQVKNLIKLGNVIGFAGITYKDKTSTLRGSQFLQIFKLLKDTKPIYFCDPHAEYSEILEKNKLLNYESLISICDDIFILRPNGDFLNVLQKATLTKKLVIHNYQGVRLEISCQDNLSVREFGVSENEF